MDSQKIARAFDLMTMALADAGFDAATITKLLAANRRMLALPAEDSKATKLKTDFAVLATEVKDDPTLDRGRKAFNPSKTS